MPRGGFGSLAKDTKCKCGNRSGWYLGGLDWSDRALKNYGIVECSKCGGSWRTSALYIRDLRHSEKYKERFIAEDKKLVSNLTATCKNIQKAIDEHEALKQKKIKERDNAIFRLQKYGVKMEDEY